MTSVVPIKPGRISDQSQPGFMDKSRRLQRLPGLFTGNSPGGQLTEFAINEWQKLISCMGIPPFNRRQNACYVTHAAEYNSGNDNSQLMPRGITKSITHINGFRGGHCYDSLDCTLHLSGAIRTSHQGSECLCKQPFNLSMASIDPVSPVTLTASVAQTEAVCVLQLPAPVRHARRSKLVL